MAFQRRLGELTTIYLVWCLFGVYFYRAPERIGRTEENIEKTHNDQYSQQYLHMSRRCYELAKEVEGIPTIPTIFSQYLRQKPSGIYDKSRYRKASWFCAINLYLSFPDRQKIQFPQ